MKAEMASRKLMGTCVPEGLTSYVQWLDCFLVDEVQSALLDIVRHNYI